jgi:RNA polymerase sigma-70 factor (ECF subfamily)
MGIEWRYNEYYHGPKPGLTRTFPQIYNVSHPSAGGAAHIEREDFLRSLSPPVEGTMEASPDHQQVTRLLQQWSGGSKEALDELMPVVYDQLRRLAASYLRSENRDHTLRATALVNEAYVRLVGANVNWQDRVHFFAVSARVLRRILVDHAKSNNRQKRGGEFEKIPIDEAILVGPQADKGILELDDALQRLAVQDPRKSELVELLFFGGLTYDEAAAALKISPATVHRELTLAKAWLYRDLAAGSA